MAWCGTINYRLATEGFLLLADGIADLGLLDQLPFALAVDGKVVPQAPKAASAAGQGKDVCLLIGSNRDEARAVLCRARQHRPDQRRRAGGHSPAPTGCQRIPWPSTGPAAPVPARVISSPLSSPAGSSPSRPSGVAEARTGAASAPTWMYRFDRPAPQDNHRFGASHGAEVPFVFCTISQQDPRPLIGGTPPQAAAGQTHKAWVGFITHANPGWPAYDSVSRTTGPLSDRITATTDPAASERACWNRIR